MADARRYAVKNLVRVGTRAHRAVFAPAESQQFGQTLTQLLMAFDSYAELAVVLGAVSNRLLDLYPDAHTFLMVGHGIAEPKPAVRGHAAVELARMSGSALWYGDRRISPRYAGVLLRDDSIDNLELWLDLKPLLAEESKHG